MSYIRRSPRLGFASSFLDTCALPPRRPTEDAHASQVEERMRRRRRAQPSDPVGEAGVRNVLVARVMERCRAQPRPPEGVKRCDATRFTQRRGLGV